MDPTRVGFLGFKELLKQLFWELAKVSIQGLSEFSKGTEWEAATHSTVVELEHKPKNEKIFEAISKKTSKQPEWLSFKDKPKSKPTIGYL